MVIFNEHDFNKENILKRILDLSHQVSDNSPPIKPFIRFSKQTDDFYRSNPEIKNIIWDFDYMLQKILFNITATIATPEQISQASVERWKENLNNLYIGKQTLLNELIKGTKSYQIQYSNRDKFILDKIKPQSRFLYLGCGSGKECINLASKGHKVIGIDTDYKLVNIAHRFSEYLSLPFHAICMDAMRFGFSQKSFDGFLLEFYGAQTSLKETMELQESLASVLNDSGKGFIISMRKRYASYWYLMGSRYPNPMTDWLSRQDILDFYYSQPDGCEESLKYGLYSRSHTIDSLKTELQYCFDVLECDYSEHDPRYVISVVKRKDNQDSECPPEQYFSHWKPQRKYVNLSDSLIQEILGKIGLICDFLKSHKENVVKYFIEKEFSERKNPIIDVQTNILEFVEMLISVFNIADVCSQ